MEKALRDVCSIRDFRKNRGGLDDTFGSQEGFKTLDLRMISAITTGGNTLVLNAVCGTVMKKIML